MKMVRHENGAITARLNYGVDWATVIIIRYGEHHMREYLQRAENPMTTVGASPTSALSGLQRGNDMTFSVTDFRYSGFGPVSFTLSAGEQISVTGASGCGKTRLLRALADLDPWQGEVLLDNSPPTSVAGHLWRRRVMYMPAESQWWKVKVVKHFRTPPPSEFLAALDLSPEVMTWGVARLSSGEKQRLALLRSLVVQPDVLLLDEPTAHLDVARTEKFEALVRQQCETRGMMAVWVVHDNAQFKRVGVRQYRMHDKGGWESL